MLIFRQSFDPQSSTYTYFLGDSKSRQAVLIDPVFEQVRRDMALIQELGLRLSCTLETHVHADHVTGAAMLRQELGSKVALSAESGAEGADLYLTHLELVPFGERYLEARCTPGHTSGCMTFVLDDESSAFTGDCLLIRGSGRTDFQQGDPRVMYRSVHEQILSLPDETLLYPGHDYRGLTVTSIAEERMYNPRLGGDLSENDFAGYMENLGLPHPNQLDIAVPANLKCGEPVNSGAGLNGPEWAPLTYTFAGVWELQPQWLEEHLGDVEIIDVREPDEFNGILGHIPGAILVPLGDLVAHVKESDHAKPIVTVCRAGGRSAQATVLLRREGFDDVANLAGGMLRWRAQRLLVEGRAAEM